MKYRRPKGTRPRLTCETCRFQHALFDLSGRFFPANDNIPPGQEPRIVIPDDELLLRPATAARLAMALKAKEPNRRKVADWMTDRYWGYRGKIFYADGTPFCRCAVEVVDVAFGEDGSFKWIDEFFALSADAEAKQSMQERVLFRLQLIALALLIDDPVKMALVLA